MKNKTEIEKLSHYMTNETVKCKCGHSVFLPNKEPVKICSHCNNLVFRDEKAKFKFLLSKRKGVERG